MIILSIGLIHSQSNQAIIIDSLPRLTPKEVDSMFNLGTKNNVPVSIAKPSLVDGEPWILKGVVVDFTKSKGCGLAFCTVGTLKIQVIESNRLPKEKEVYVIVFGDNDMYLGAVVNFEVRYLSEQDTSVFSIIYNKFVTDEPFLYHDP
jgi:hypothetical protein